MSNVFQSFVFKERSGKNGFSFRYSLRTLQNGLEFLPEIGTMLSLKSEISVFDDCLFFFGDLLFVVIFANFFVHSVD